MLHAAAMLAGVFFIAVLAAPASSLASALTFAGVNAVLCVAWAVRFGGVWRGYRAAPAALVVLCGQLGGACMGALRTVRLAASARLRIKPSLLRLKPRFSSEAERTVFAAAFGATAGRVVVESAPDGVLAHLLDEPSVEEAAFDRLEARVRRSLGAAAPRP